MVSQRRCLEPVLHHLEGGRRVNQLLYMFQVRVVPMQIIVTFQQLACLPCGLILVRVQQSDKEDLSQRRSEARATPAATGVIITSFDRSM